MAAHPARLASVLLVLSMIDIRAADVTGRWTSTFTTEIGEEQYTFEFTVRGTTLTGTAKTNLLGENTLSDGQVDGQTISFVENATFMEMPIRITYTGTMTSEDEIAFTRTVADVVTEKLVARRAK